MTKEEAGFIKNARFSSERCLACLSMNGYRCSVLKERVDPLSWCIYFQRVPRPTDNSGEVPERGEILDNFRSEQRLRGEDD